ncbi:MAG TPA: hypothetical protein VJA23_06165 [Candidatus Nanoarchaeia archaeon]|nr:hypothetical protein [Candidatus Nanoarchaeia archaeon]
MTTTTIKVSDEIAPKIRLIVNELDFKNQEEFFQEAIRDKVIELNKKIFFSGSEVIANRPQKKGISAKDILSDFGEKRHK